MWNNYKFANVNIEKNFTLCPRSLIFYFEKISTIYSYYLLSDAK